MKKYLLLFSFLASFGHAATVTSAGVSDPLSLSSATVANFNASTITSTTTILLTTNPSTDAIMSFRNDATTSTIYQSSSGNNDFVITNGGFAGLVLSGAAGTVGLSQLAFNGNSQPIRTNAGMSAGTQSIDDSAILQADSTTKGFLPPRMSTAQRDLITPVEGLVIYNVTTHELQVSTSSAVDAWVPLN